MLTGMTKKQEEIGFTVRGIRYYRHNDKYYKQADHSRPVNISKHAFVEALQIHNTLLSKSFDSMIRRTKLL